METKEMNAIDKIALVNEHLANAMRLAAEAVFDDVAKRIYTNSEKLTESQKK